LIFEILGETAAPIAPGEGTLDEPTAGENDEALGDVRALDDLDLSKPWVSTRMWRFLPLIFLPASQPLGSIWPPFFGALHALTIDDVGCRAGLAFQPLATLDIQSMMNAIYHAVIDPQRPK
jgi:hypothetical protein